jgi:hypothetical protein
MLHELLLLDVLLEVRLFSSSVSHGQEDVHEAFSGLLRPLIVGGISATVVLAQLAACSSSCPGANRGRTA